MSFIIDRRELKEYIAKDGITDVVIPDGVFSIDDDVFRNCEEITSVVIPDSVKYIKEGAFYNCTKLKTVTMSKNILSIGEDAFGNCHSLKKVYIQDLSSWCTANFYGVNNPLSYGKRLYINNNRIGNNLIIPEGTNKINSNAFYGCEDIESITVPSSVIKIRDNAFKECHGIRFLSVCSSLERIGIHDLNGINVGKLATIQAYVDVLLDIKDLDPKKIVPFYVMVNFSDVTISQKEKEAYLPYLKRKCQKDDRYYISYAAYADNKTILDLVDMLPEWRSGDHSEQLISMRVIGGLLLNSNLEAMRFAERINALEHYESIHRNDDNYISNKCRLRLWS